jgi:hypothetical protein
MRSSIELKGYEPDCLGSQIASLWEQWNAGRQVWLNRVKEVIQYVYATSTKETSNVTNPWSHTTVVPKLTQINDNLAANYGDALFTNREFFTFDPANLDEAVARKRKAVEAYLTTKHDYNGLRSEMDKCLVDWVQTGNCFGRVDYVREEDYADGEDMPPVVIYEGPKFTRISPYDINFDHTASEFKNTPKAIRELITRGEFFGRAEGDQGKEWDQATVAKAKGLYSLLAGMRDADINKNFQMKMDGFTSPAAYFNSGKVELLHFIGDIYDSASGENHRNRWITIIDRRYVLVNKPIRDYQGFQGIYHCAWRKRPDNLYGQGPLDNIVGMQYRMNHLENARSDGFDQMLAPDRVHIGNVEEEKNGPVTNYYVDDAGGDVKNLAPDPTVLNADNQIERIEAQMEMYAGAPREAMGIRSPGEKTKFEVQRLENATGRLFQNKIKAFEQEMVEPVINGELEVAVRALNGEDIAKVMDDDLGVVEFMSITAADLMVKGKLRARGASHYAKQAQLVQELQGFEQVLAQDPSLKVHFPAKERARAWNDAMGFDRLGLYRPFGQVAEAVELHEFQSAAQSMMDETNIAGVTDADAQARAAGAVDALPA